LDRELVWNIFFSSRLLWPYSNRVFSHPF